MTMLTPVLNQATDLAGTPVGGVALIPTAGMPQSLAGWTATLDYQFPAAIQMNGSVISMTIPAGVPPGAAIVQLTPPGGSP